jgi:hypothetical protein
MIAIVFSGPSLPSSKAPVYPRLEWRPPVRQGDVYRAAQSRPALIGIVDGYFETVATVWHKEILWAMAQGIHVYGAASIGALRAAELADFGMKGVGAIFRQFYTSALADDDEIAVLHGPEELDYIQVTEAMVNVRATINRALQLEVISPPIAMALLGIAKSLFYKDRTYEVVLRSATEQRMSREALRRFAEWLPEGRIDQKRVDALEMIEVMSEHLTLGVSPLKVTYQMAHTFAWEYACRRSENIASAPSTASIAAPDEPPPHAVVRDQQDGSR